MDPLLPVVRRCTQPVALRRAAAGNLSLAPVRRPVGEWTEALLVEDRIDRLRYVQEVDLRGLTLDDAWATAFDALSARAHEPIHAHDGIVEVRDWGGYASSLVLLPAWRATVGRVVGPDPLFLAPDVDHLRVVDAGDPRLDDHLAWAFTTFRQTPRPLSPAPLFQPERAPRNLRLLKAFAYAEQDEVLLETAPEGIYVGETVLALTGTDAVLSTRVEPGYRCWLPEVDQVELPTGRVAMASLALPAVPGVHPVRRAWPAG